MTDQYYQMMNDMWAQHTTKIKVVGSLAIGLVTYKLIRYVVSGGRCTSKRKLQGKTVMVTGANCGIGLETARDMARRGARVLLACRNVGAANDAAADIRRTTGNGNVEVYQLDLSSLTSVRECASQVLEREERLDILINNAGVMACPRHLKTSDGFELQFGTNHLGHFLLTNLVLDLIKRSQPSRIVNVSSEGHHMNRVQPINFDDITNIDGLNNWQLYSRSKLANILFTKQLHVVLEGSGVTAYSLHPGIIQTQLTRHMNGVLQFLVDVFSFFGFLKTPVEGAQTSIYCAVQEGIEQHSGKYFSDCRVKKTGFSQAEDPRAAVKLWNVSAKLVNLQS